MNQAPRGRWARVALLLVAPSFASALGASACQDRNGAGNSDGGGLEGDGSFSPTCPAGVDKSVNVATAKPLAPEEEAQDYICPRRDKDFYKLVVPEGQGLVRVSLQHGNPISKINLTYVLLRDEGGAEPSIAGRAPDGKRNRFEALHCLGPGTYYIQVQDAGDDAIDDKTRYRLSYSLESDQEGSDGDNEPETAKELTGSTSGTISCNGDADYYLVRGVGANQLLQLKLTTSQPSPVDYKYTVLRRSGEAYEPFLSDQNDDGSREPTAMELIAAVPGAGDYFIRVEDVDGNDSDAAAERGYTLELTKLNELDPNEDNEPRNDHPNLTNELGQTLRATSLGSFNGGRVTFASSGRIASKADVDFFRIDDARGGGGKAVIEIELEMPDGTKVDPSVALVYPTNKNCTKDKCCNVIDLPEGEKSCVNPLSCTTSSFVCQDQGQAYCADPECAGDAPPSTCASTRKCAGAVLCLKEGGGASGKCGATQFFRPAFNEVQDGGRIRTGQPLPHAGPWYIRVADQGGDDYDYNASYNLRVVVATEPDAFEYDNGYFPRLILSPQDDPTIAAEGVNDLKDFFDDNRKRTDRGALIPAPSGGGWSPYIEGFISYENDVDYFQFQNPCHNTVSQSLCMLEAEYSATGSGCPAAAQGPGSGLEFRVNLSHSDGGSTIPREASVWSSSPKLFGHLNGDGCQIMFRDTAGETTGPTLRLEIFDEHRNNFSSTCGYRLRFRVAHVGCAAPPDLPDGPCKFDTAYRSGATEPSCYVR